MDHHLLEKIREDCRTVAEQAEWVRIDSAAIPRYAAAMGALTAGPPRMDPAIHHLDHGEETAAYFCVLAAVNFGSGYFPAVFGSIRQSGYRHVAAALTRWFERHGPLRPADLEGVTRDEIRDIFALPGNEAGEELATLFSCALREFGAWVGRQFSGDFCRMIDAAAGSAERLVSLLAPLPAFADSSPYRGSTVGFLKRAQLLAVDLNIAFGGARWGSFTDLDRLTICADNLVPHVLRHDGLLDYHPELAARIDRGDLIPAGSPEEVEIRASAIHACELILQEMRREGNRTTAMMLDNILWHRGQEPRYRQHPRHLTRTTSY